MAEYSLYLVDFQAVPYLLLSGRREQIKKSDKKSSRPLAGFMRQFAAEPIKSMRCGDGKKKLPFGFSAESADNRRQPASDTSDPCHDRLAVGNRKYSFAVRNDVVSAGDRNDALRFQGDLLGGIDD